MYRFHNLEKLHLDNNKIDDNNIFSILCAMENLRYLSVAYNFLSAVPKGTMEKVCTPCSPCWTSASTISAAKTISL